MEQGEDEPLGLRSLRDLADPSFRHVLPSRRRPARRDKRRADGTLLQRSTTGVQRWRRIPGSYLTSRSFDFYACCRVPHRGFCQCELAWSSSNHGHTFGKMISFLCGSIARAKTRPAQRRRKTFLPAPSAQAEGRHGSFVPSSVPNFQGKIARVALFDIDDGSIHRWGEKGLLRAPISQSTQQQQCGAPGWRYP